MTTLSSLPQQHWLPVESNPETFNNYATKLGLDISQVSFIDVLSTEEWALEMVPSPIYAMACLFPIKEASEAHKASEEALRVANLTSKGESYIDPSRSVFFIKQSIPNACGTIALIHAIANAIGTIPDSSLSSDSWLQTFISKHITSSPDEKALALENDKALEAAHDAAVQDGQSDIVDDTWQHFFCLVENNGILYELDGRKQSPISHGPTSQVTFLTDCITVIRGFMARDPEELRFTMLALTKTIQEMEE
jgi:ubiquitin carboxyl-terminal hydrolase L3